MAVNCYWGGAVGRVTALSSRCADRLETLEPKPFGTLRTRPGLYMGALFSLNFLYVKLLLVEMSTLLSECLLSYFFQCEDCCHIFSVKCPTSEKNT